MIILIRPSSQTTLVTVNRPWRYFSKIGDLLIKPKIMTIRDIPADVVRVVQYDLEQDVTHST
jgi:hypothetical protein